MLILSSVQMATGQQLLQLDREEIHIQRSRFGVPHIFAGSVGALFYGNGYAVAQDRFEKMERHRRDACGEMAEIDPRALARDRDARKLAYTEAERQQRFDQLTAKLQPFAHLHKYMQPLADLPGKVNYSSIYKTKCNH